MSVVNLEVPDETAGQVVLVTQDARERAIVVLRYFEDLTEVQAAELLGCSVGTVKRQNHLALARLRALAPSLALDPAGASS